MKISALPALDLSLVAGLRTPLIGSEHLECMSRKSSIKCCKNFPSRSYSFASTEMFTHSFFKG